jgi:hypothetical protein
MENRLLSFNTCLDILYRLSLNLRSMQEAQKIVRAAVLDNDWDALEPALARAEELSAGLGQLENEREAAFAGKKMREAVRQFTSEETAMLLSAWREAREAALKVRIENESFSAYIRGMTTVVGGFLDAAFPERTMYSRSGKKRQPISGGYVVNKTM